MYVCLEKGAVIASKEVTGSFAEGVISGLVIIADSCYWEKWKSTVLEEYFRLSVKYMRCIWLMGM